MLASNHFSKVHSILSIKSASVLGCCCGLTATIIAGLGADWPQYRGPARDGKLLSTDLKLDSLPTESKPVWRVKIGGGFASPVVASGRVFYSDEQAGQEVLHALDEKSGKELWNRPYAAVFSDEWGTGPRCTPVVNGDRVFVQSCKGVFRCLSVTDGRELWGFDFEKDYGVKFLGRVEVPEASARRRGHSGSAIPVKDQIVVAVGNTNGASLVCLNQADGKVVWKCGNDEAAYSNLMEASFHGVRQVVAYTADSLMGVRFDNGAILWRVPIKTAAKRHAVTPIVFGDRVIVSSHTHGLLCYQITRKTERSEEIWESKPAWANKDLKISLATLVELNGTLYGQGPEKNLVAVNAFTGQSRWSQDGFGERSLTGYTSTLAIGNRLLALSEQGVLVLLEANPDSYQELSRLQVCGKNWSHPAFAKNILYLRDNRELFALDLRGK